MESKMHASVWPGAESADDSLDSTVLSVIRISEYDCIYPKA